jgi:hypothetical protein
VTDITMITAAASALTVIGSLLAIFFIYQLWSAYRSNPRVAMAAIFNQGRGAFMIIGASLLIFALVHLAGIIIFSFYATDDSGWVFGTTNMFHSIAANFIWGIAIAIRKFGSAVRSTSKTPQKEARKPKPVKKAPKA